MITMSESKLRHFKKDTKIVCINVHLFGKRKSIAKIKSIEPQGKENYAILSDGNRVKFWFLSRNADYRKAYRNEEAKCKD